MMSTRLRRRADWGRGQNEDHRPCQPFQKPQLSALVPSLLIAQEAFTKGQSCYCYCYCYCYRDDLYRERKEGKA